MLCMNPYIYRMIISRSFQKSWILMKLFDIHRHPIKVYIKRDVLESVTYMSKWIKNVWNLMTLFNFRIGTLSNTFQYYISDWEC